MTALQVFLSGVPVFLLAENPSARTTTPPWLQGILPQEAKVIETAPLNTRRGNTRGLVLWMLNPKRILREGERVCSEWVYGDHWYGPTRLSLIDLANRSLINTIEIRGLYEGADEQEHGFRIPFRVSNSFYHVPQSDRNKEGAPRILNLRDLTGEGVAGQFVLFEYEVCGTALTTVLGYSGRNDAVVHFRVEISNPGEKLAVFSWVPHLFQERPIRPGQWDFTWEPGHGADCWIHEQVSFDPARQLFVNHRNITPYPDLPVAKQKH